MFHSMDPTKSTHIGDIFTIIQIKNMDSTKSTHIGDIFNNKSGLLCLVLHSFSLSTRDAHVESSRVEYMTIEMEVRNEFNYIVVVKNRIQLVEAIANESD